MKIVVLRDVTSCNLIVIILEKCAESISWAKLSP
jgi:hypothetical protein